MKKLEIRRVKRYGAARYPRKQYGEKTPDFPGTLMKRGALSFVMLALLESSACDDVGTTGPPPVMPSLVTENEARRAIEQAFGAHGIGLQEDVGILLHYGDNDSTLLTLDGYNDSLRVGYEYVYGNDFREFSPAVRHALDSLIDAGGPYIEPIDVIEMQHDYNTILQQIVDEFVDTLKAHGVI
jgi:hypothetical protein